MPAVDEHGRDREPPPPRLRVELAEFPLARAGLGRGVGLDPNALVDREGVVGVVLAGIPEELAAAAHERALGRAEWRVGGSFFEPYEGAAHYQQVPIKNIHWRSWGGREAVGRGTYFYNSGYHAPVRFRLYRPVRDHEGDYIYTRIRGVIGRGCTAPIDGRRWCDLPGRQQHFRSRI
jgi:hypothetical protein